MFDFYSDRRDFLRIGSIGAGMSSIGLSDIAMGEDTQELKDSSVVWVWLGGGPTQFETFHAPKEDSVPDEYQVCWRGFDRQTNRNGLRFSLAGSHQTGSAPQCCRLFYSWRLFS